MASSVPPSRSKRPLKPRPCRLGPRAVSRQMHPSFHPPIYLSRAMPSVTSLPTGTSMTGSARLPDVEIWAGSVPMPQSINCMY